MIEILTLQCIVDLVSQLVEGAPLGHPIRDHVGVLANISDPYDGFDDDDGYPAYSHHDKIPPWWGNVSNDEGGNVSCVWDEEPLVGFVADEIESEQK